MCVCVHVYVRQLGNFYSHFSRIHFLFSSSYCPLVLSTANWVVCVCVQTIYANAAIENSIFNFLIQEKISIKINCLTCYKSDIMLIESVTIYRVSFFFLTPWIYTLLHWLWIDIDFLLSELRSWHFENCLVNSHTKTINTNWKQINWTIWNDLPIVFFCHLYLVIFNLKSKQKW